MDEFGKSPTNKDEAPADAELLPVSGESTTSGVFFASDETALFRPSAEFQKEQDRIEPTRRRIANRYIIRREIGAGGFGRVLEAHDEVLDRVVAIKVARRTQAIDSPQSREFQAEARLAAKITHPNIVTVFDWGVENGQCFVVFEYVAGRTLADRIKNEEPIDRIQAIRWIIDIAQAVHAAHKFALVHRDLKPANILLDETDRPRVADFGLAMSTESREEKSGEIAGSPPYMAPEQLRGQTENFDARTDVWALGIILFELFAKRRPFGDDTKDQVGLVNQILHGEAPHLREFDSSVPLEIDAICHRCLAKDINDRWESAEAFAKALEHALQGTFTPQAPISVERGTIRLAVASIATAVCFAAAIFLWVKSQEDVNGVPVVKGVQNSPDKVANPTDVNLDSTIQKAASQSEDILPTPGKWFPLLSRPPQQILWPEDLVKANWIFQPAEQLLRAQSTGHGLLKIGEAAGDYDFKAEISEPTWSGTFGIVFGLQEDTLKESPAMRCQVIAIKGRPLKQVGHIGASLDRTLFRFTKDRHPGFTSAATVSGIPAESCGQESSLAIKVRGGKLATVLWNGIERPELHRQELDEHFSATDHYGGVGVYLASSSGVLRKAELLLIDEETK